MKKKAMPTRIVVFVGIHHKCQRWSLHGAITKW